MTAQEKLAICKACPYYNGSRCAVCGCLMGAKVLIPFFHCPKNRW